MIFIINLVYNNMRKYLIVLFVCFLVVSFSVTSIANRINLKNIKDNIEPFVKISSSSEDDPLWAIGNFTGEWGLNVWGSDWFSIGSVHGYYGMGFAGSLKFGRFLITSNESNGENSTKFEGLFIGPYLLGEITDMQTKDKSAFVGLGDYNATAFHWRIMGMTGPTLFMKGTFNDF